MTRIALLLPLALAGLRCEGVEPAPAPQALRDGCAADDRQIGTVNADDEVEVKVSFAGTSGRCYKIVVHHRSQSTGSESMTGWVLGESLPAIAAFVAEQQRHGLESLRAQEKEAQAQEKNAQEEREREKSRREASAAATHPPPLLNPNLPDKFEEFAALDTDGGRFSLASLGGKLILVTFWSPKNATSKGQLLAVLPLYKRYKRAGLRAVGISMDPNPAHIAEALDDLTLGWPQIPDRFGLAKRYSANAVTGTTLVLDGSHHILAAGLPPADLEKLVRELLTAP